MSWTYELKVANNGGKWSSVAVYFATMPEALQAGQRKFDAWTLCEDFRAVPSDQPVNYRLTLDGMVPVGPGPEREPGPF